MSSGKSGSRLPGMGFVEHLLEGAHERGGVEPSARPFIIAMIICIAVFFIFSPLQTLRNFNLVLFFAPLWAPLLLCIFAFQRFVQARRAAFIKEQETILLEMRLPRDTKKTPLAMEIVFSNLNFGSGETTWYKKYWKGSVRPWWAVEIVSLGGQVRFYIWTRASMRRGVESFFYAQYPDIEIIEAEDYSRLINPSDKGTHDMFGVEYVHTKEDAYPIKSYVDYGLDKPGLKPEEQTDPLAQVIELMSSVGPNEQFWFQIMFRQSKSEKFGAGRTWKDEAQDLITNLRLKSANVHKRTDPLTGQSYEVEGLPNPTPGEKATIEALERNISKPGFDVGMRSIYVAKKGHFDGSIISFQINMLRPFSNEAWNGFRVAGLFSARFNDYPWEDRHGHHKQHEHERLVEYYRRRAYFHPPYVGPWIILSTEELATVFHVPSGTVEAPNLPRIQSATGGAPANLPT